MAEKRRRGFVARLIPWLLVFVLGGAAGYYVRDQQQSRQLQEAVARAQQDVQQKAVEAIRRGRRAGENVGAGAKVAADSAIAAFRQLTGDTTGNGGG